MGLRGAGWPSQRERPAAGEAPLPAQGEGALTQDGLSGTTLGYEPALVEGRLVLV